MGEDIRRFSWYCWKGKILKLRRDYWVCTGKSVDWCVVGFVVEADSASGELRWGFEFRGLEKLKYWSSSTIHGTLQLILVYFRIRQYKSSV